MRTGPDAARADRRIRLWTCVFLAVSVCAVYGRMLGHAFVAYDTPDYVTSNPFVLRGLTWETVRWAFTSAYAANWHPLTWLSHALDVQLFGLRPLGHHAVNLGLHVVNTLFVFGVLERLTGARGRAAFVALLFGLHPLHVESAAWVVERKDLLSTCFGLLAIGAYAAYAQRGSRRGYAWALVFLAIGLLSKPMLVTWPCVFLLLDFWPLSRLHLGMRRLVVEKLPFAALVACSAAATLVAQRSGGAMSSLDQVPLQWRAANALFAYAEYVRKTFWPSDLALYYPHLREEIATVQWVWGTVLVAGVSLTAILLRRTAPFLFTGWFWFVGTLVPVIGIVQVGGQAMADRYTYVPLIGLFTALVWGVAELAERRAVPVSALRAAGVVLVGLLGFLAWRQVGYWRDTRTLCEHAIAVTRGNYVAHNMLGYELAENGEPEAALEEFDRALTFAPADLKAIRNRGVTLMRLSRVAEAEVEFRKLASLAPEDPGAQARLGEFLAAQGRLDEARAVLEESLRASGDTPQVLVTLAKVHEAMGRPAEARAHYERALARNANDAAAHAGLARLLIAEARWDEAARHLEHALALDRNDVDLHVALSRVRLAQGRARDAVDEVRVAMALRPNSAEVQGDLAWILATSADESVRDVSAAFEWAERATRKRSADRAPRVWGALAAAYAAQGKFDMAIEAASRAATRARELGERDLAARVDRRIAAYRSRSVEPETIQ